VYRSVDTPGRRFNGVTTKMVDYKPFKIHHSNARKKQIRAESIPAYPGQYMSTTAKDFLGKEPKRHCKAENWPQLPIFGSTSGYYRTLNKLY
jgi:hypothetical protein